MAAVAKKVKVKWDPEAERKLIDIWADILEETSGKMMTRKKKEAVAVKRLNEYLSKEFEYAEEYSEKAVSNKIDTIMKKGKQMYLNYQRKGEMGKEYTPKDKEIEIDIEAAKSAWPNFATFFNRFKDHPSLGPGSVDDSAVTPIPEEAIETTVVSLNEDCDNCSTPAGPSSRCPSRASNLSTGTIDACDEDITFEDDDGDDDDNSDEPPAAKKKKKGEPSTPSIAIPRVGKKKGMSSKTGSAQFLFAFSELQEKAQARQIEHETKMQQEAMTFQQKLEQDRIKFESNLSSTMSQQNQQFQMMMMQQNQAFQAELFKKLFDKKEDN